MLPSQLSPRRLSQLKATVFVICLFPLGRLIWLGLNHGLGANPIEFITRSTGTWTLTGILITLSITPLRKLTGMNWLLRLRRMLGLYAFFYACLHLTTYLWLDQFFDLASILKDIAKRPFITIGFSAWLLLLPLALTSTNAMMKRLGRRWQQLHRAVYAIGCLAVVHYWWLVKKDVTTPAIYGAVLALLLGYRLLMWLRGRTGAGSRPATNPAPIAVAGSREN